MPQDIVFDKETRCGTMSDKTFDYPEFKCYGCSNILKLSRIGDYILMECPKCGFRTRYTLSDYEKALQIKKEAEARQKELEKHYEL
jgi:phage FluMu protein Com